MRKIDLTNFQVATSEIARQINRRIALNFIRRHQPLSRADLARRSGLQRSTISSIIDQLIKEGWITEAAGHARRGRRPRFLRLNVERSAVIAVELRPERTTVGLAGIDARFLEQASWPTPRNARAFIAQLSRTVAALRAAHPTCVCEGMGVSLPGRVDASGRLVFAPNLGWGPVSIRSMIEAAVKLPVIVENAANACALAELWFGHHPESVRNLVAVTISEGIGVGLLLNGQLVQGGSAMAGEFGHVSLDDHGPPCPCGNHGCWERYASNSAAVRYYLDGARDAAPITFDDLLRLYAGGDARATQALQRMAHYLGLGLAGLATGLAPEAIVIVGEVTQAWDRIGPIVDDVVRRRALPNVETRIVPTDPAMQPRLRGAATLVIQQHFGAPNVA